MSKLKLTLLALVSAVSLAFTGCSIEILLDEIENLDSGYEDYQDDESYGDDDSGSPEDSSGSIGIGDIPAFSGEAFVELNNGMPEFDPADLESEPFEYYSELDGLGRCGVTYAMLSDELMPTEDRKSIGNVKPSGWINVPYDFVDGKYLYNRCHLIGFQLAGENDNERNLITGTRYMNVTGMLPFENMVADYIKETGDNVFYRVTPVYDGSDLVALGVQMEAYSVSDEGESICFNVFCYNVQPGVRIDYATGESEEDLSGFENGEEGEYVLNTNNRKFHLPSCQSVKDMNPENREDFTGSRDILIAQGYIPCGRCKP